MLVVALAPAWGSDGGAEEPAERVGVVAREFRFEPQEITVERGEPVTVVLENRGSLAHNLAIEALDARTETIQSGDRARLRIEPEQAGTYVFRCRVPGHAEAGMKGTIRVVDGP